MNSKSIAKFTIVVLIIAILAYIATCGITIGDFKISKALDPKNGIKRGIDIAGGSEIVFEPATDKSVSDDQLNAAQEVLRTRLTANGYTEAIVSKQGSDRIRVEIPAVDNPEDAVEMLGATAKLSFVDYQGNEVLGGEDVKSAKAAYDTVSSGTKEYIVKLQLSAEGAKKFAEATEKISGYTDGNNIIAIMLDDELVSSPSVSTKIDSDECYIQGDFDKDSSAKLANQIQSGQLPFSLEVVDMKSIGATLGEKALSNSITAAIIGLILVMLFMTVYYRMCGFVSCISLIGYISIMMLILGGFRINLTLPGIAGVILTIGTAVDANVIIFERVKEEMSNGKTIRAAVDAGFDRAFTAILDSNVTTVIAAVVLYVFGTGTIKGFAITLFIGTIVSMFTAIFVTRFLLRQLMGFNLKNPKLYCSYKEVRQ